MDDREAYELYADPANRQLVGTPRKRRGQRLTVMASVRFRPEVIESVRELAFKEGVTVGAWIRRLVQREIEQPQVVEVADETTGEPVHIPHDALAAITAALMPAIIRHGSVSLRIGAPRPEAGAERPSGLIEGSGRRGEAKAFPSTLSPLPSRTFACPHLAVGNVTSVSCGTCGPLQAVA